MPLAPLHYKYFNIILFLSLIFNIKHINFSHTIGLVPFCNKFTVASNFGIQTVQKTGSIHSHLIACNVSNCTSLEWNTSTVSSVQVLISESTSSVVVGLPLCSVNLITNHFFFLDVNPLMSYSSFASARYGSVWDFVYRFGLEMRPGPVSTGQTV